MPRETARRFTGLETGRSPRPAGRSGWVSARAISCPEARSRANARSANSGVPAKTRRRKARSGCLAQLLGQLGANALLLELRQVLDEHLALQVIHLVLDADREQPLSLERESGAVLVIGANLDPLGTLDQLVDRRQRKAAFLDVGDAYRLHDLWIDQNDEGIAPLGDVDHDDLLVDVDLGRRETDTGGRIHGLRHVGHELLQGLVEDGYRGGYFVEPDVGVAQYVQNSHLGRNSLAN